MILTLSVRRLAVRRLNVGVSCFGIALEATIKATIYCDIMGFTYDYILYLVNYIYIYIYIYMHVHTYIYICIYMYIQY